MSNRNQCQLGQTVPGQCIYKNITGDMAQKKLDSCTSTKDSQWKGDYKLGGTVIIFTAKLSSLLIRKGKYQSDLERWTFTTILEDNNNKTTIFNDYMSGNKTIELIGNITQIKQ